MFHVYFVHLRYFQFTFSVLSVHIFRFDKGMDHLDELIDLKRTNKASYLVCLYTAMRFILFDMFQNIIRRSAIRRIL